MRLGEKIVNESFESIPEGIDPIITLVVKELLSGKSPGEIYTNAQIIEAIQSRNDNDFWLKVGGLVANAASPQNQAILAELSEIISAISNSNDEDDVAVKSLRLRRIKLLGQDPHLDKLITSHIKKIQDSVKQVCSGTVLNTPRIHRLAQQQEGKRKREEEKRRARATKRNRHEILRHLGKIATVLTRPKHPHLEVNGQYYPTLWTTSDKTEAPTEQRDPLSIRIYVNGRWFLTSWGQPTGNLDTTSLYWYGKIPDDRVFH